MFRGLRALRGRSATAAVVVCLLVWPDAGRAAQSAALFPFELSDTTEDGLFAGTLRKSPEKERLPLMTRELSRLLGESGRYAMADLTALAAEIENAAPLHKCNGCEADLAKKAGSEIAVTALIEKATDLLFNMSIFLRDAQSGEVRKSMSVVIQGNTDEAWLRALRSLVKNKLLDGGATR